MKKSVNKYTKEVEEILTTLSLNNDRIKADKLKKYVGTNLYVHGLVSKVQVEITREVLSFVTPNFNDMFVNLCELYHTNPSFEGKNITFIYLEKIFYEITHKNKIKLLPQWVTTVDNWAHSDSLSKFLNKVLLNLETKKQMLSVLKTWNTSENFWERRQSLVALFYYSRTSTTHIDFNTAKKLVLNLISDNEYYVQKAVGWTLREAYNVYPKETYTFIDAHILKITPTAFTTCIEKMNETQKENLKLKRKKKK